MDHNQIAGAKNILLNISVNDEENLIYDEVIEVLTFIQQHASVRDEHGAIHTANIIWGNSVKPALGDALEIVLVATGFEGEDEDVNSAMERIVKGPVVEPVKPAAEQEQPTSVLEPIKPTKQPQRPQEPAVLGARSNRYDKIDQMKAIPAYQARNSKFVVKTTTKNKEVLRDEPTVSAEPKEQPQNELFKE